MVLVGRQHLVRLVCHSTVTDKSMVLISYSQNTWIQQSKTEERGDLYHYYTSWITYKIFASYLCYSELSQLIGFNTEEKNASPEVYLTIATLSFSSFSCHLESRPKKKRGSYWLGWNYWHCQGEIRLLLINGGKMSIDGTWTGSSGELPATTMSRNTS